MFILEGILLGFASILLIGPVVFILINASIYQGKKAGIAVALGILIGDIIYTIACYNGLNYIIENPIFTKYVSYIGFAILFGIGFLYTFKKHTIVTVDSFKPKEQVFLNFMKGFSINFFNPFVLSVWLFVANYAKTKHTNVSIVFLISVLTGIFLIDLAKVFLSKYLKSFIGTKKLLIFYKVSGIIMLLFAIRILLFILE